MAKRWLFGMISDDLSVKSIQCLNEQDAQHDI